jgi:DNA-3-methyladenine glycosylase
MIIFGIIKFKTILWCKMPNLNKLPLEFYRRQDVLEISRNLLGKVLLTRVTCNTFGEVVTTGGIIVETEAYGGPEDKASHAYGNRRTTRTETMFAAGGVSYVYLCYGIHHLFNVVTGPVNSPSGVLIRAIEPIIGIEFMLKRRKQTTLSTKIATGPGVLSSALGIAIAHNCTDLTGEDIWIEDHGTAIANNDILATPRIGIDYAQEFKLMPWRFILKDNLWVSNKLKS